MLWSALTTVRRTLLVSSSRLAMRQRCQLAIKDPNEVARLLEQIKGVIFIATPHTGSAKADLLNALGFIVWPTFQAKTLVANDPALRELNIQYRSLAREQEGKLRHQVFYEMQAVRG